MPKVHISKVNDDILSSLRPGFVKLFKELKNTKSVLIKPNFLNSQKSDTGTTTDIDLLISIVKLLKEFNVKDIVVAEASFTDTEGVFKSLGVYGLEKFGVRVVNLENEPLVSVNPPFGFAFKSFSIPKIVDDADVIISAAKMKTHSLTGVSLSIKNLFGFFPHNFRMAGHVLGIDDGILDIYTYLLDKRLFAVVDAIVSMEGRLGPAKGSPVKTDLVIMGDDLLAVDVVCSNIMGADPKRIRHLSLAKRHVPFSKVSVSGKKLSSVKRNFSLPPLFFSFAFSRIIPFFFRKTPYLKNFDKCVLCGFCVDNCPKKAIKRHKDKKLVFDYSECISCMCCVEACDKGALDYKISFPASVIYLVLKKIYGFVKR